MKIPHVLVVDDNAELRKICASLIRGAGFAVEECENGLQAMKAIDKNEPCLILLDLRMPVMGGKEFMAEFTKRTYKESPLPVFLVSANADAKLSRQLGCTGHLEKPYHPDELLAIVAAHCQQLVTV